MKIRDLRDYLNALPEEDLDKDIYVSTDHDTAQILYCEMATENLYFAGDCMLMDKKEYVEYFEEDPEEFDLAIPEGNLILNS